MEAFYWMQGKDDGFIIASYPDGATAAALATVAASTGAIAQAETHEIFDRDAQTQIVNAAKAGVGVSKPPTATSRFDERRRRDALALVCGLSRGHAARSGHRTRVTANLQNFALSR